MRFLKGSILCLSLFYFSNIFAVQKEHKIYIQPDQVRIEHHGIFVDFPNQSLDVLAIHRDSIGTYVMTSEYRWSRCPNGHYSLDGDGLCDEPGCPYNR